MDLNRRELAVLHGIVESYIRTGQPVPSHQVVRTSGLGLSSATIRSVVSRLEDAGWVTRAHASAGSIPSDTSLREYVEMVGSRRSLPAATRRRLCDAIEARQRELMEDFEWVACLLADVTSEAGMAVRPMAEQPVLAAVSLVPIDGGKVLGVLVATDGSVEKKVLDVADGVLHAQIQEAENWIGGHFRGHSLDRVREELERESADGSGASEALARDLVAQLLASDDAPIEVLVAGTDNLLATRDFSEVDRVRSLMRTLGDRGRIAREWRRGFTCARTQVIIGAESEMTAAGRLGMVATLIYRDGRRAGAVGVVGPRRMDYGRIVPTVEYIGETLTRMLDQPGATHA